VVADAVLAVRTYSLTSVLLVAVPLVEPLLIQILKVPAALVAVVVPDLTTIALTTPPLAPAVYTVETVPVPSKPVFALAASKLANVILGVSVKIGIVFAGINNILVAL
jgi:hypothetical protein